MDPRATAMRPGPLARDLRVPRVSATEVLRRLGQGERLLFVDARREAEWRRAPDKLPGAVRLPPDGMDETLPVIPRGSTPIVYCTSFAETSSMSAATSLLRAGCPDVRVLYGGLAAWRLARGPMEPAHRLRAGRLSGLSAARVELEGDAVERTGP